MNCNHSTCCNPNNFETTVPTTMIGTGWYKNDTNLNQSLKNFCQLYKLGRSNIEVVLSYVHEVQLLKTRNAKMVFASQKNWSFFAFYFQGFASQKRETGNAKIDFGFLNECSLFNEKGFEWGNSSKNRPFIHFLKWSIIMSFSSNSDGFFPIKG